MHRGYVKFWRKTEDSAIWKMPPLYLKLWVHLLCKVNWKDKLLPTQQVPKMGIWIAAGTIWTNLRNIADGVSYDENNRTITPDAHTISRILKWLEEYGMITMDLSRQGTLISVTNWRSYQGDDVDLSRADTHSQPHGQPHGQPLTKEVQEVKEVKEKKRTTSVRKAHAYSHEYEELWKIHHYGVKSNGWEEYQRMDSPPPHSEMVEILKSQVAAEMASRGTKDRLLALPHMERWIKYRMWENGVVSASSTAGSVSEAQKHKYDFLEETG